VYKEFRTDPGRTSYTPSSYHSVFYNYNKAHTSQLKCEIQYDQHKIEQKIKIKPKSKNLDF